MRYTFSIFDQNEMIPKVTIFSCHRWEFLQLIEMVSKVPGYSATMSLHVERNDYSESVSDIKLKKSDDWDDNDGWYVHYALACVEGKEVEVLG